MATILVLQHHEVKGARRLGATLRDHGFRLDVRRADLGRGPGAGLPADLDGYEGVVCLGGPQNVDDGHAWLEGERSLLREAHERGLGVVGICLGHQQLAAALGGKVVRMERPEVGMVAVTLTGAGREDAVLAGVAWTSPQAATHWYEVSEVPAGGVVLASSARCGVQAFRVGHRSYGFQYHVEFDRELCERAAGDAAMVSAAGITREGFLAEIEEQGEMFARLADRVCVNLAGLVFAGRVGAGA